MSGVRARALRLLSVAAVGVAIAAIPSLAASPSALNNATCPNGMVPNPAGYGCVPALIGGNVVGAPSQEILTRCNGNYWICVWPYPVP